MATTDQQNALKDAMARAKQIAAKLQQQQQGGTGEKSEPEEKRKRTAIDTAHPTSEPEKKKNILDMATDPKLIAQQVAKSLVQKAHTGPMLVEEITIPNKLVGLVIGKGGEMINKLQSESGAKVQVAPDPPSNMAVNERQITITGNAEAVGKAKSLIAEIQNSGKVPERLMAGTLPGDFSIEMNIAKGKVGLIIGKGGENIKSLQERAGCKMVLLQTGEYANTPEKPLRISGEQSAVMYGKQLVLDLLTSKELEGMNPGMKLQEGQGYKEIHVPREVVGLVIGAKGVNIQQIQMETGCRIRFNNDMEGPTKTAMLSGDHQQVAAAEVKLNELISANWGPRGGARPNWGGNQPQGGPPVNLFNSVEGPRPGWGPPQGPPQQGPLGQFPQGQFPQGQFPPGQFPPGQGPPGQGPFGQPPPGQGSTGPQRYGDPHIRAPVPMGGNSNLPPGHKHVVIHLPANKCGLVIGKGGETIKFIQNETSVDIDLDRDVPETFNYRVFQVKGTEEQIEKALSIIREKANDPSIVARPIEENQGPEQSQWGAPSPWAQPQNQQWNQQQQWPGQQPQPQQYQQPQQPPWSQEPVTQPGQPAQPWNQQPQPAPGWNQPPTSQPSWDPQQQQQQQQQWPNVAPQGQWPAQQQWAQPGQQYPPQPVSQNQQPNGQVAQPVPNPVSTVDPTQTAATQVTGQPDYSAAWALYYQQQQQYYQQYAMQQPGAVSSVPAAVSATTNTQASATSTSADTSQAQAMAEYQAKLAEYYKSLGQQPPQ